jgi:hypothetical protein
VFFLSREHVNTARGSFQLTMNLLHMWRSVKGAERPMGRPMRMIAKARIDLSDERDVHGVRQTACAEMAPEPGASLFYL